MYAYGFDFSMGLFTLHTFVQLRKLRILPKIVPNITRCDHSWYTIPCKLKTLNNTLASEIYCSENGSKSK